MSNVRAIRTAVCVVAMIGCQPATGARTAAPGDCPASAPSSQPSADLLRGLHDEHQIAEAVAKILATGDPVLRDAAAAQIVLIATVVGGPSWRDAHRAKLAAADQASSLTPTSSQFEEQLGEYQDMELQRLHRFLGALGGEAAIDYAFDEASDTAHSTRRRQLAVDLAENLVRSGARRHAAQIPALAQQLRHPDP